MDTCGALDIGAGETTTIIGSPVCGYCRRRSDSFGLQGGGAGVMEATFGTSVIGALTSDSTAELTMDLVISEPGSGVAIGKAAISFIIAPAGMLAPGFTILTLTIRG